MRFITLSQPWPWALCHAGMDVLNMKREFTGVIGERIGIHAGKQWDDNTTLWAGAYDVPFVHTGMTDDDGNTVSEDPFVMGRGDNGRWKRQPFSAVVAVATITGSHEDFRCEFVSDSGKCSAWAMSGTVTDDNDYKPMWHWELADVRPLTEPVPAKGRQGLWIPDAEIVEAVEAQL